MLCCSLDIVRNGCHFYFLFWVIFCPFTSLTTAKSKFFKKWKKHLEILLPKFFGSNSFNINTNTNILNGTIMFYILKDLTHRFFNELGECCWNGVINENVVSIWLVTRLSFWIYYLSFFFLMSFFLFFLFPG